MSTGLRELLDQRSTPPSDVASAVRLSRVRRRIALIQRRRRVAVVAGLAVIALAAVMVGPNVWRSPAPVVGGLSGPTFAFPPYVDTYKLVSAGEIDLPADALAVTVEPSTLRLLMLVACGPEFNVEVQVNGHVVHTGTCATPAVEVGLDLSVLPGIELGSPLDFTIRPTTALVFEDPTAGRRPIPANGRYGLAIYERVFPAYPPPSRPADIRQLVFDTGGQTEVARIDSDGADPGRALSTTIAHSEQLVARVRAQGPGLLRIRMDGQLIGTYDAVDYTAAEVTYFLGGVGPNVPATVTIEVDPEGMLDPWALVITCPSDSCT